MTNGFTAKEFEPDSATRLEDGDDGGTQPGTGSGPGHNRSGKPTEHARVGETLLGAIRRRGDALCRIHDEKGRSHLWYSIRTGSGRCYWSRPSGSSTRSR